MSTLNCCEMLRCIGPYADGELAPSEMLAAQQHLEDCELCAERVRFHKAVRSSVRNAVGAVHASERLRARVAHALAEQQPAAAAPRHEEHDNNDVLSLPPRMLSWRVVGPLAAAAALSLVLGSLANKRTEAHGANSAPLGSASMMTLDTLLEEVVDQHAHPLPPETTNPTEVEGFDRFVGVPVRPLHFARNQGTLLGARMVPMRQSRAAMLQYVLNNGHRISVYVYNPHAVRMVATPRLRERRDDHGPVYVGFVRGYSVAVADRRGVGYALASDLNEQEMLAVDFPR